VPITHPSVKWRVAFWSLAFGVIFAIPSGVVLESAGTAAGNPSGSDITVGMSFDPSSALTGLLLGTAVGALTGMLWYLPRYGTATAAVLLTAIGGLAGTVTAALVGARTTVIVSGNSMSMEHGAPSGVLVLGFALGVVMTALALWSVRRSAWLQRADPAV
jgi:hypothetical protein